MAAGKLVFIDETGFIVDMNRIYGWSKRGQQAVITARTRGKRLSVVGAMALDGQRGMLSFNGTLNKERMVEFVREHLGPQLKEGDVVVMDGLSVHRCADVRDAIEAWGASVLILPPYSPELNPIEHLWSTMKARIRAVGASSWRQLVEMVTATWSAMPAPFFRNWIRSCGYVPST